MRRAGFAAGLVGAASAAWGQCPANWGDVFPGGELAKTARGSAVFDDGNGPSLFVVGDFHYAGAVPAHLVARWDGRRWWSMGDGLGAEGIAGSAYALAAFDDDGPGPHTPMLYAAGSFSLPGASGQRVARWNGASWEPVGTNFFPGAVYSLVVHDDGSGPALYAGGDFAAPGGVRGPARWNGTTWSAVGTTFNNSAIIRSMAVYDPDGAGAQPAQLYVGGTMTSAGGAGVSNVARWDGAAWTGAGAGRPAQVNALTAFDDGSGAALYAGSASGDAVARWNGATWSVVGGAGQNTGTADALLGVDLDGPGPLPPTLYVGGNMNGSQPGFSQALKTWSNGAWSDTGQVLSFEVFSLAAYDPDGTGPEANQLYAAGQMLWAGSALRVNNIARYNGAAWSRVGAGGGVDGLVSALYSGDPDGPGPLPTQLIACGSFTNAGTTPAVCVARWDGGAWSPYGPLTPDPFYGMTVNCCTVWDDGTGPALYIGGWFADAVGTNLNGIAKWNGVAWVPLGSGVAGTSFTFPSAVWALASYDEDGPGPGRPALFVGGDFLTAGGVAARNLARWDGQNWSAVYTGATTPTGRVLSMMTWDDGAGEALYISGARFGTTTVSSNLVKWNGSTFTAVGPGSAAAANAMAVFDDDGPGPNPPALYIGGSFTTVGGTTIYRIARFNGSTWSAVGSGFTQLNSTAIGRMAVYDDDGPGPNNPALYVQGTFTLLLSPTAYGIAKWNGTTWSAVGAGLSTQTIDPPGFSALCVHPDALAPGVGGLYAGGSFTAAGGVAAGKLARWGPTPGPMIGQSPLALTRDPGASAMFNVAAGGSGTLTYQWRKGGQPLSDGGQISGSAIGTLIVHQVSGANAGAYDCVVSSGCGSATSSAAVLTVTGSCYANCDGSTAIPALNIADFTCFLQKFAASDSYANCDNSTAVPVLNIADFTCFLQKFAAGCP